MPILQELFPFVIQNGFLYRVYTNAMIVQTQANQLIPQFLMEQFDALLSQCRHIEDMHRAVWLKQILFFLQNSSYENLDNLSLIWLLYMHLY